MYSLGYKSTDYSRATEQCTIDHIDNNDIWLNFFSFKKVNNKKTDTLC